MDLHVWGCPEYVLDPKIQQGQKLPRWEPRSKRGFFLGLSQQHVSEVTLVLSLGTGSITTQFHVVFDDLFTTVTIYIDRENEPPEHWAELCLQKSTHLMLDSTPEHLNDDWLTEEELEIKHRRQNRDEIIREATEQRYGASSILHPGRATGPTEVPCTNTCSARRLIKRRKYSSHLQPLCSNAGNRGSCYSNRGSKNSTRGRGTKTFNSQHFWKASDCPICRCVPCVSIIL
jgi:hypothetical protein